MDVTPEVQLDLPGSERAGTGSPAFPQQEGLYPNPASPGIRGLPSPAGGAATSTKAPQSPGAAQLAFPSSVCSHYLRPRDEAILTVHYRKLEQPGDRVCQLRVPAQLFVDY